MVNDIAPRPHNSGHYTIEACHMSQYEAHLKPVLGRPIPAASLDFILPNMNAIMLNKLGGAQSDTHLVMKERAESVIGTRVHDYGKGVSRPGRKMGHITLMADSMSTAEARIAPLIEVVDNIRTNRMNLQPKGNAGSKRAAPSNKATSDNSTQDKAPEVGVIMGSKSDSPVLAPGIALLQEMGGPLRRHCNMDTPNAREDVFVCQRSRSSSPLLVARLIYLA